MSTESKLNFTAEQLLENHKIASPLIVRGIRYHGGFDSDGRYCSPRTRWRSPAIAAWQKQHVESSGLPIIEIPRDCIPPHLPSLEQVKLLLGAGIREPIVRTLTEIAIVEGLGATIRDLPLPPLDSFIREDCNGSALVHLSGLFEAHARDEAGWGDERGHRQMWEAVRDLAFSRPKVPSDIMDVVIARRARSREGGRLFPRLPGPVELLISVMTQVLIIEFFAMETFRWAESALSDPEISDAPTESAELVRHIRSDEAPHIEYLRTVLTELSARTLRTDQGAEQGGGEVVQVILDRALRSIMTERVTERRIRLHDSVRRSAEGRIRNVEEFISHFDALETQWQPPARYRETSSK